MANPKASNPLAALRPGAKLHGFKLIEKLGAGGFGEAWLAENLDHERFALKIPANLEPKVLEALRREVDLFRRLRKSMEQDGSRPPIVYLKHDFLESDPPALAMEYVAGGDLRRAMRGRKPMSYFESLTVIRDVLEALDFAHGRGIIHRDLSPENILFDPSEKRWKVADFGLGRLCASAELSFANSAARSSETAAEDAAIAGKLHYMAPEQRREGTEVGPPADLYALGVIWAQLLTGQMEDGIPPLWQDEAPKQAQGLIKRCVNPDPEKRWPTASTLQKEIDRIEAARPVPPGMVANVISKTPTDKVALPPSEPDFAPVMEEESTSEAIASFILVTLMLVALASAIIAAITVYGAVKPDFSAMWPKPTPAPPTSYRRRRLSTRRVWRGPAAARGHELHLARVQFAQPIAAGSARRPRRPGGNALLGASADSKRQQRRGPAHQSGPRRLPEPARDSLRRHDARARPWTKKAATKAKDGVPFPSPSPSG
jgi:serine/threonine protein kinase